MVVVRETSRRMLSASHMIPSNAKIPCKVLTVLSFIVSAVQCANPCGFCRQSARVRRAWPMTFCETFYAALATPFYLRTLTPITMPSARNNTRNKSSSSVLVEKSLPPGIG